MTDIDENSGAAPEADEPPEDNTELVLKTWGMGGEPVHWAPTNWQALVSTIRAANLGFADAAVVQTGLDATFPGMGYQAANVMLSAPVDPTFTPTVDADVVTLSLRNAGDLTDDYVSWDLEDGSSTRGLTVTHAYGDDVGEHWARSNVTVAGARYTDRQTFETEAPSVSGLTSEPVEKAAAYDPGEHNVDEVLAYAAEHPDEVDAIAAAEDAGKGRVGILDKL